ncbi:RNA polymerase sigma factor [Hyunsoonleella flava]|uniref:RNA polymerase sigma factor n=1 Tax=Hyunsoonleella flava TaxID=2527939 RepID=A0A4Q9FHQ5_9FLAO|nr:RNA polymerase sigma factor [Hyunsoonleella flava]TBN06618.1 RNA polymerase sigma factor [Hyunsoonleella flava]
MQNDTALISNLKNKDEAALSQLYDAYAPAIYGVIIRMCKDEQHAQNILQDTFLTIWEKSHQYNPDKGKFYTWAYRIAKNKTLNFLRKDKKLIQTEDLSVYKDKEESITDNGDYLQLKGCLKQLEPHHQRALELVYFNGLTHREAHEEMDVPLGSFKSYIKQALKKLKLSYDKAIVWFLILIEVIR